MDHSRIDLREPGVAGAAGAFGARLEGQLPVAAAGARQSAMTAGATPSRSWWARTARLLRNAAVAVAVMTLLPIGMVAVRGDHLARAVYGSTKNMSDRIAATNAVRQFALPADPSVTPMQAGLALNALVRNRVSVPGFETIEPASRPEATWRGKTIAPDLFVTARPDFYDGPSSQHVLEAAAKGFSPGEQAYLRELATAPVWREFDLVARARAVDVVGGRFRIPFGENAFAEQRPEPQLRDARDLAMAAVSRAAYHMSLGQRDSAEMVLRSIVSFGFALVDNGSTSLEELIGAVIVGHGRDALQRFYLLEHDPRAALPGLQRPTLGAAGASAVKREVMSADEARRRLLARIADPAVPHGQRFESARSLPVLACTNVRELLLGPRADVTDALAQARHTVARFPSEQALLDLESRLPTASGYYGQSSPIATLAASASTIAGAVLQNPRLVACTRIIGWGW